MLASTVSFFAQANDQAGLITYATVLVMLLTNMYSLDFSPKSLVRWMIYLDAVAFLLANIGTILSSGISPCTFQIIGFVADLIWAFKDACKYSYIVFKGNAIAGYNKKWPHYLTALLSLVLYFNFMAFAYNFSSDTCVPFSGIRIYVPKILLYSFWTIADLVPTAVIIYKMTKIVKECKNNSIIADVYTVIQHREEMRLLFSCVGMFLVTAFAIINAVNPSIQLIDIWRIVFVYIQLLLVLGSAKITKATGLSATLLSSASMSKHAGEKSSTDSSLTLHTPTVKSSSLLSPHSMSPSSSSVQEPLLSPSKQIRQTQRATIMAPNGKIHLAPFRESSLVLLKSPSASDASSLEQV